MEEREVDKCLSEYGQVAGCCQRVNEHFVFTQRTGFLDQSAELLCSQGRIFA